MFNNEEKLCKEWNVNLPTGYITSKNDKYMDNTESRKCVFKRMM